MRLIGTDVADQDVALVDPHAHTERHPAFRFPLVVQLFELTTHSKRSVGAGFGILGYTLAFHVAPNRHDGVANELIERASIFENHAHHMAKVLIQMSNQLLGISLLAQSRKPNEIGKQDADRFARPTHAAVVAAGVFENFFDQILRNVTFECAPGSQLYHALECIIESEGAGATEKENRQDRHGREQ